MFVISQKYIFLLAYVGFFLYLCGRIALEKRTNTPKFTLEKRTITPKYALEKRTNYL